MDECKSLLSGLTQAENATCCTENLQDDLEVGWCRQTPGELKVD